MTNNVTKPTPDSIDSVGIDLTKTIGLGVAGNFTGHLEQAGEASDFVAVQAAVGAPKGMFPFYVPRADGHVSDALIHAFPVSNDTIRHPGEVDGKPANLQIEPEIALLCTFTYGQSDGAGRRSVVAITPTHFGAHNDCSIRKEGAVKISEKKNWGAASKGFAFDQCLPIDVFTDDGVLGHYRLACFLKRDGLVELYGEDSAVSGYGYMYDQLIDWMIEKLNRQQDMGPLEDLADWLRVAAYPSSALISIGSTRYTEFGKSTFLRPGDESIVVAYDSRQHNLDQIIAGLSQACPIHQSGISVLRQAVVRV